MFKWVADIPGKFWVALATISLIALLWLESYQVVREVKVLDPKGVVVTVNQVGPLFKAPTWYVTTPAGIFCWILGLYVLNGTGATIVDVAKAVASKVSTETKPEVKP